MHSFDEGSLIYGFRRCDAGDASRRHRLSDIALRTTLSRRAAQRMVGGIEG